MASQSVTVMLAPLPESRPRWKLFAVSCGVQLVAVLLACQLALLNPATLEVAKRYHVTIIAPLPEDFTPPPPVKLSAVRMPPPALLAPRLELPQAILRMPRPPVERPAPAAPQLQPELVSTVAPAVPAIAPKAPAVVHTGAFGADNPTQADARRRPDQVQTGGFGDPNGSRAPGVSRPHLAQARFGSFDLPAGPGYGNGTGGTRGERGAVAVSGFGGAAGPAKPARPQTGTVQSGGFGDVRPLAPERHTAVAPAAPVWLPVEIISKPRPAYTEEAKRLKIEGEVLLQARFRADGELQVLGVSRGLGYGLDESAVRAAQQIRFRPARQDGVPVDSVASLHVMFQLAY